MSVNEKMTAIADAIRDKTGGGDKLTLDDMAESIGEVYEAGKQAEYDRFWDSYQDYGNRTDYAYAFAGAGWNESTLKPKHNMKPIEANSICNGLNYSKTKPRLDMTEFCKKADFSQCTTLASAFGNANVENLTINAPNVTSIAYAFQPNSSSYLGIENLVLTISEKCTNLTNAFLNMFHITRLIFTKGSVITKSVTFARSNLLTDESVQSIIDALADLTGKTAQTVTWHTDIVLKLTDEQMATILAKNWLVG